MALPAQDRQARRHGTAVAGLLLLWGAIEGLTYLWNPPARIAVMLAALYGPGTALLVLSGARTASTQPPAQLLVPGIVAVAAVTTMVLATVVLDAFPLSADEFGYTYLADTLRHARLWNASFPPALHDVLQTFYIPDQDGKRVSQYPPGWPAVLAPFRALHIGVLANPTLGVLSSLLLLAGLRRTRAPPRTCAALLAIGLLAPFTLFNNASFFSHTLAGAGVLAIAVLSLRERDRASPWNDAAIGLAFSVLLVTRSEVFAVALVIYLGDGVLRHRTAFLRPAMISAAAGLPIALLLALYNWRITGSPFVLTELWGSPGVGLGLHAIGVEGRNGPGRAILRVVRLYLWWGDFAGVAVLPLYIACLGRLAASRRLRWFDLMLPAIILFFIFYPDTGGYQYGPRYWFVGWAVLPLTLASGLAEDGRGCWRFDASSLDPLRFAALQVAAYAGFAITYGLFAHAQVAAREVPLQTAARAAPLALVLIPDAALRYTPWQRGAIPTTSLDFTRNGPDGLGPVALGRDLGAVRTALLCRQMPGRTIWRVRLHGAPPAGRLERVCVPPARDGAAPRQQARSAQAARGTIQ